jgi:hypothetical protein
MEKVTDQKQVNALTEENVNALTPKPKAKRVMNEAMLDNLRKAREKALASRQEMKLLKEREDILKQEEIDARWDKLHEEEERIKTLKSKKAVNALKPVKASKVKKSKIIHVSPPLSEVSSVVSSSSEEDNENVIKSGRRAHRNTKIETLNQTKTNTNVVPALANQTNQTPALETIQQNATDSEHIKQLHRAMRALGLAVR